ncbi:hypothetical protein AVMA1855_22485 [Acidovorax sp. SUPP1855]|uniref:hypothetical protein n=1 Tax=Acidovorax sp. SUPP1855 TaxID=431774 RepID=UPI0023DE28E5|nr:hypothetical protein [Acidovorax sp. SUPP1855]GKS86971.1 hypothetical protein AVMA1855_22485 [Acidovorax sp. SUPP1855]
MNEKPKNTQPATLEDLALLEQKIGNALRTFHAWVELRETEDKKLIPKAVKLSEQVLEDISDLELAPWRLQR